MIKYTGKAWKLHIASDFIANGVPLSPNGVGAGGSVYLDYNKMIDSLDGDYVTYYYCGLDLIDAPITMDNDFIATIHCNWRSIEGFKTFT